MLRTWRESEFFPYAFVAWVTAVVGYTWSGAIDPEGREFVVLGTLSTVLALWATARLRGASLTWTLPAFWLPFVVLSTVEATRFASQTPPRFPGVDDHELFVVLSSGAGQAFLSAVALVPAIWITLLVRRYVWPRAKPSSPPQRSSLRGWIVIQAGFAALFAMMFIAHGPHFHWGRLMLAWRDAQVIQWNYTGFDDRLIYAAAILSLAMLAARRRAFAGWAASLMTAVAAGAIAVAVPYAWLASLYIRYTQMPGEVLSWDFVQAGFALGWPLLPIPVAVLTARWLGDRWKLPEASTVPSDAA